MALGDGENDVEMLQVCFTVLAHLKSVLPVVRMLLVRQTAEAVQLANILQKVIRKVFGLWEEVSLSWTSGLKHWTLCSYWKPLLCSWPAWG